MHVPIFDADNHMYETREAFTKFLPKEYRKRHPLRRGRRPDEDRRQRSDQRVHPEPDLRRGGPAGAQEEYYRKGNPDGKSMREIFGEPIKAPAAFREPAPAWS